ncbi:MAG: cation-translocating P-type ATPase, partial [Spirochaetaceae bacterium]
GDGDQDMGAPGGEDLPFVFSGTLVVQGQGVALVRQIGAATEMGKIGKALQSVEVEETLLKKETGKIVRATFVIALILSAMVVVVFGITQGNWIEGILSGLTLAMAMLPEEFPVVLTVFLALGAWRMSKKNVLTRKVAAIETLGAATVFCVDKTGTLTQNKMSIQKLYASGKMYDVVQNGHAQLPEAFHELVEHGILASKKDPFDPMEQALVNLGKRKLAMTEHIHPDWEMVHEYPLSRELLALSHVWASPDKQEYCISAKGAPEAIMDLCHLESADARRLESSIQAMAAEGLRVLGVAHADFQRLDPLPDKQHDFDFKLIGLLGLADPIRETVPAAVDECTKAGIRVVMITGDYPVTACNIAGQIGIPNSREYIAGPDLAKMTDGELKARIMTVNVFARVIPEQKLKIVNALKENGEIVSMTGDGVNDAPALKSAHIGIAMGERGTDVAREASNLVLLDDSFPAIVAAVRMGRRIFDNLRKAMAYIISVHIPIAGMSLLPVIFQWKELVLHPVHIVFLELIIDPACSIVFEYEPEEADIMTRPPRKRTERLFSVKTLLFSVLQGLVALGMVFGVHEIAISLGQSTEEARTMSFIALIISNLFMILVNRTWRDTIFHSIRVKNSALVWVMTGAIVFLGLVVYVPGLNSLFRFSSMHWYDVAIAMGAGIIGVLWFEIVKIFLRKRGKSK